MDQKSRYRAIMNYQPYDRLPVWYFGMWEETLDRWLREGLSAPEELPRTTGMDPDWEAGMWECHGIGRNFVITDIKPEVVEETDDYRVERNWLGAVLKIGKHGSSIPLHIEEALTPDRDAWRKFKTYLDPADPRRWPPGWEERARALNKQERVITFVGASLFGFVRDWMGVETLSTLPYTDPVLFEDILDHMTDFFIGYYGPIMDIAHFDFVYIFEDCCFNNGPLFSPQTYNTYFKKYYRKLTDFYHGKGIDKVMLDSDGRVDLLIPHWLDSGIDILFPIEVGTWRADPVALRREYGRDLRMMGGVDKHIIPQGERVVRPALERLRDTVAEGGFIPIPDHRIPPDCSLDAFKRYVDVFKDVFRR